MTAANVRLATLWALAVAITGCATSDSRLEPRFVAVHNAMAAMGFSQSGAISEGSLPEGGDVRIDVELQAGKCYTYVALGGERVHDLDLRVVGEGDREIGRDSTHDRQAAAQICPTRTGDYQVVVTMTNGHGSYLVTSWSVAPGGAPSGPTSGPTGVFASGPGTCSDPLPLAPGRPVHGNTQQGAQLTQGECATGAAPEQVYRLTVEQRVRASIRLTSTFDGALYVLRQCGQMSTSLGCNDDDNDTNHSRLDLLLDPGTYFVVVDGYGSASGEYDLEVDLSPLRALSEVCADAVALVPGTPVTGTTDGEVDYFQATCAGGARSPDKVHRLDVTQPSRIRIRQMTDHDGVLYVRRSCEEPNSEIGCNDDFLNVRQSLITAQVAEGSYYVYVDGYASGGAGAVGSYTLTAEVAPAAGGGAPSDTCATAEALALGSATSLDTFTAVDDLAGTCGGQGAPDVVRRIDVTRRSRFRATVRNAESEGVLYLRSSCGDAATEVSCDRVAASTGSPTDVHVDRTLDAGTYFLVWDGARADSFGAVEIEARLDDLQALSRMCQRAPMLTPGRTVNDTTAGQSDEFQASCAEGAQSPDRVYRLRVQHRSRVVVTMSTTDFDGALHLRRSCDDASSEVACNDDEQDNRHSRIDTVLDRGLYYVVADGFRTGNQGNFSLEVQVTRQ